MGLGIEGFARDITVVRIVSFETGPLQGHWRSSRVIMQEFT